MLVSTITLSVVLIGVLLYYLKTLKHEFLKFRKLGKLPAPPCTNVIIGNVLHLHTSPGKNFEKQNKISRQSFRKYF
jgi:hypothetical protein